MITQTIEGTSIQTIDRDPLEEAQHRVENLEKAVGEQTVSWYEFVMTAKALNVLSGNEEEEALKNFVAELMSSEAAVVEVAKVKAVVAGMLEGKGESKTSSATSTFEGALNVLGWKGE